MTNPHHRGFVTGHMSPAGNWSCWGLNPGSFFLSDSRVITFKSLWVPHSLNKGAPYWVATVQSNPLSLKCMANVALTERKDGSNRNIKEVKTEEA